MAKRFRKKNKRSSTVKFGETATPERRRQLGGVETEIVDRDASGKIYIKRQRSIVECALDYYWRTHGINDPQRSAGMKLREIYLRVTMGANNKCYGDVVQDCAGQGSYENRMQAHLDSIPAMHEALAELSLPQAKIVFLVCCQDKFAGHSERKKVLQHGLDALAKHFGIT